MTDDDRWHPWYAWWPVKVAPLTWRWLTVVQRRMTREAPNVTTVEYRLKAGPSSGPVQPVASVGTHTPDEALGSHGATQGLCGLKAIGRKY